MKHLSKAASICAAAALATGAMYGQSVISAKSGLVHYTEGSVSVDGKPISGKAGVFSQINKGGVMTTEEGRAEVLMTPGVFLRVGENTGIRMVSTSLSDTRVAVESGRVLLESDTPMKGNIVTLLYKDVTILPTKTGLYELIVDPPQLKVYSGEVDVAANGFTTIVKEGSLVNLMGALAQGRFVEKDGDDLYRWSKLRSGYISQVNASAAGPSSFGNNSNFNGVSGNGGSWYYNSAFGMYTFMPFTGAFYGPFGYSLLSPDSFYQAYPYGYNYGSNYPATPTSGGGSSGSLLASLVHPVHISPPPSRSTFVAAGGSGSEGYRGPTSSALGNTLGRASSASTSMGSAARGGGGSSSSGSRGH